MPPEYDEEQEGQLLTAQLVSRTYEARQLFQERRAEVSRLRDAYLRLIEKTQLKIEDLKDDLKAQEETLHDMLQRDARHCARIDELEALMDEAEAHGLSVLKGDVRDIQGRQREITDLLFRAKKQE